MKNKEIDHILIVDDEKDICLLVRNILKRKTNATIDVAYSVSEGKKKLQEKPYDLAFFDVRLSDGSGIDLVKFVQTNVDNLPYIAMISAYTSKIDLDDLEQLKINQFIPKPLSSQKIINCLLQASA